ncbi:MAG: DinB family protein [Ignavibacteriales bacterium]|nr:MAG: damage-inducible protein DinB [Ignavibacteriaceae bacterium]MBW7874209.1 damage-inducible protein DinB [Ignavibacteria bacterium]MCZ2142319.1 DinB family protein [Ignavibacteriales bacterium]OQY78567.1 MAG: hypothetical protein B6D45_02035 [Ignavibacteriales bacterium UTCHB3]MBV6445203.1 hypothetical protein [Ignavibacteriaceae bacterium]
MISDQLRKMFTDEFAGTRKVLERVDFSKYDFKPHAKSFSFGDLSNHVANLPNWGMLMLKANEFRVNPGEKVAAYTTSKSSEELLERYDKATADFLAGLEGIDDAKMQEPWSFYVGDQLVFTMPRVAAIKNSVMKHMIHHRGQLTVYLRMNDIAVPGLYGPSADE